MIKLTEYQADILDTFRRRSTINATHGWNGSERRALGQLMKKGLLSIEFSKWGIEEEDNYFITYLSRKQLGVS